MHYYYTGDREGDEMMLHPFKEYAQAGAQLWDYTYVSDPVIRQG